MPKVEVPYSEKVSRLFIFRFLWIFIAMWPMMVLAFWVGILMMLHFWYMLFMGKRHEYLWSAAKRFFVYNMEWKSYLEVLTDERPGFWWK